MIQHIVFFPGWSVQETQYSEFLDSLQDEGFIVHALSHRHSHGRSSQEILDFKFEEAFNHLEKVGTNKAIVIGHSIGSIQASQLSADHRVSEVILVAPMGVSATPNWWLIPQLIAVKSLVDLVRVIFGRIKLSKYISHILNGIKHFTLEPIATAREALLVRGGISVDDSAKLSIILSVFDPMISTNLRAEYYDSNVLVVPGGHDELIYNPKRIVQEIVKLLKDS